MSTKEIQSIKKGMILKSKRDGAKSKVVKVEDDCITILYEDGREKMLTKNTVKRWWEITDEEFVLRTEADTSEQAVASPADDTASEKSDVEPPKVEQKPSNTVAGAGPELYEELKKYALELGCAIIESEKSRYRAFRLGKRNIADLAVAKKHVAINVNSKSLTKSQMARCRRLPDKYRLVLDTQFVINSHEDLAFAYELMDAGKAFRTGSSATDKK